MIFNYMRAEYCFKRVLAAYEAAVPFAIISIQEPPNGGGYKFLESKYCHGVLTLMFDDATEELPNAQLITKMQARDILVFVRNYIEHVEEFAIHCTEGKSRSFAIAMALSKIFNDDPRDVSKLDFNRYVYDMIIDIAFNDMIGEK